MEGLNILYTDSILIQIKPNKMKKNFLTLGILLLSLVAVAQLNPEDKIYLTFKNIEGEVNVNGDDAVKMLRDYVLDKSLLIVVDSVEKSDYTLILSVYEKNIGNRMGKIDILDSKSQEMVFESKWTKGTSNMYYGYSGTRHSIGIIFKKQILKEYPEIVKPK